jgi:hypothetical protein
LARTLKARENDHRRWAVRPRKRRSGAAEHLDDRVMHDLHDLLRAGDRFEDALADRTLANGGDELADDLQVHVGFQEGDANVTEGFVQIRLAHARAATKTLERVGQAVRELLQHKTRL